MGFKSDQFYGINGGVGQNGIGSRDADLTFTNRNPRFAYPGPLEGSITKDGKWDRHLVQRGFMKVLPHTKSGQAMASPWATSQLFFQFNPQTIRRSVSMRSDFMNPLLQDPGQFTLPVPGNANFTFDLMFDRSMELNSSTDVSNEWWASDSPMLSPSVTTNSKDPSQLGVLVDMNLLDQIVGQGISKDMIEYIVERGNIIYSQQVAEATTTTTNDDGTTTSSSDLPEWDEDKVRSALDNNIGNQAFLIPNPVRVVFSSLFMVDGFVQHMDVAYVKFTQTMIPQQVVISISMEAMYLGFARAKTFLTTSLENSEPAAINDPSKPSNSTSAGEAREKLEALLAKKGANITKFKLVPRGAMAKVHPNFSDGAAFEFGKNDGGSEFPYGGEQYVDPDEYTYDYLNGVFIKGPYHSGHGEAYFPFICENAEANFLCGFPAVDSKDDPIFMELGSGSTAILSSISYSWSLTCKRKKWDLPATEGETLTDVDKKDPFSVPLFNYEYSSPDLSTSALWKDNKQKKSVKVANSTFSDNGNNTRQARRFYVTTRMNDDQWASNVVTHTLKPDSSGFLPVKWVFSVVVNVTDSEGNVLVYSGQKESQVKLDDAPDFEIDLKLKEAK